MVQSRRPESDKMSVARIRGQGQTRIQSKDKGLAKKDLKKKMVMDKRKRKRIYGGRKFRK